MLAYDVDCAAIMATGTWTLYRVKMKVTRKETDILPGLITVCRLLTSLASITLPSSSWSIAHISPIVSRLDNVGGRVIMRRRRKRKKKKRNEKLACVQRLSFECAARLLFGTPKHTSKSSNLNISSIKPRTLFYIGEDGVIKRIRSTRFISNGELSTLIYICRNAI